MTILRNVSYLWQFSEMSQFLKKMYKLLCSLVNTLTFCVNGVSFGVNSASFGVNSVGVGTGSGGTGSGSGGTGSGEVVYRQWCNSVPVVVYSTGRWSRCCNTTTTCHHRTHYPGTHYHHTHNTTVSSMPAPRGRLSVASSLGFFWLQWTHEQK